MITDDEAHLRKTGQSGAQTVAALNRNADKAHTAALAQDVQAMQEQVETERAIKQAFVRATLALVDEAYRSRFGNKPKLVKAECASAEECVKNPQLIVRTPVTKEEFANADPGSILAVNGILNDERRATSATTLSQRRVSPVAILARGGFPTCCKCSKPTTACTAAMGQGPAAVRKSKPPCLADLKEHHREISS